MTTPRDDLIAAAKDVPGLLASAQQLDPALYTLLTGGNHDSVWYAPIAALITALAAKFGLGWDATTSGAVAAIVLFVGTAGAHWFMSRIAMKAAPATPATQPVK